MDDWEFSDYYCPKCGENLRQRDCEECGGEGMTDDLYEEDPLWYDPGTYDTCHRCNGESVFFWCGNEACDVTRDELRQAIYEQSEGREHYGG